MNPWPTIPIGELVQAIGGGTPSRSVSRYYDGDIPWITPKDMKSWEITSSKIKINQEGVDNSTTKLAPVNSVLIVVRSGILKHTVPIGINRRPVAINQDIKALICTESISPEYLAYFLLHSSKTILGWVKATTADNFSVGHLKQLPIPLPPRTKQEQIVRTLDTVRTSQLKRLQAIELLNELAQSAFFDKFGDRGDIERRWPRLRLDQIASDFRYGTSRKSDSSGFPALRIPNVVSGDLDLAEIKTVPVSDDEFNRLCLRDGDLLFVRTNGNPDYVGRCAVFSPDKIKSLPYKADQFIFASYLIRVRVDTSLVTPTYVREFMLSTLGRAELHNKSKTSAGQFNLNTKGLGSVLVPVPPLEMQLEFEKRIAEVAATKAAHIHHLAKLDELFASLQQRAFRGDLWDD